MKTGNSRNNFLIWKEKDCFLRKLKIQNMQHQVIQNAIYGIKYLNNKSKLQLPKLENAAKFIRETQKDLYPWKLLQVTLCQMLGSCFFFAHH